MSALIVPHRVQVEGEDLAQFKSIQLGESSIYRYFKGTNIMMGYAKRSPCSMIEPQRKEPCLGGRRFA